MNTVHLFITIKIQCYLVYNKTRRFTSICVCLCIFAQLKSRKTCSTGPNIISRFNILPQMLLTRNSFSIQVSLIGDTFGWCDIQYLILKVRIHTIGSKINIFFIENLYLIKKSIEQFIGILSLCIVMQTLRMSEDWMHFRFDWQHSTNWNVVSIPFYP